MLARRVTRVVFDGVEETQSLKDPSADTVTFDVQTGEYVYLGFFGKFASRHFKMGVANTAATTLTVEYWDGTTWSSVLDLVDETQGFTQDGFISWINQDDWKKTTVTPIDDVELFYVRISVSVNLDGGTTLQSVLNIFCDDTDMIAHYPELITDTRYLPAGKSDFLEQYIAAKNRVILKLKQRRVINDESQVLDLNDVSEAAVHAAAEIILTPIDQDDAMLNRAKANFKNEINDLSKSIDENKDGIVSQSERDSLGFGSVVRR